MAMNRIGVDAASGKAHIRNLPPTGQPDVLSVKFIKGKSRITLFLLVFAAILLGGCSGGSGGDSTPGAQAPASAVAGAGVKGPLAGAVVNLYHVDLSAIDLKGSLLDQGSTDAAAAFQGLALPAGTTGPVLVAVVADADTIDITSGAYPVLDTLYTVVDAQRIIDGDAVYATPLTTMAVKLARAKADTGAPYSGNGDRTITQAEFTAALALAQGQVKATLGFGLDSSVDIFSVPPLLTDDTDTAAEQEQVVRYRQAIEALAAVAQQVADDSTASDTPQQIFEALIDDLVDGEIDGENSGVPVAALAALDTPIDTTLAGLNLNALTIPGTTKPVSDIEDQLAAEVGQTGAAVDTTDLESGAVAADLDPPVLVADSDGDGVRDDLDAFPLDSAEWLDSDSDGVGDNSDAFPNDPTETVDSDSDGVGDNADAFPSDPTEWLDSDSDGVGDNSDAFPTDATETVDTDGDGVGDNSDAFPTDPTRHDPESFIGGTVSGLEQGGSLVLQNSGADDLTVTADGAFNFSTLLADGSNYAVSIAEQPTGLTCFVTSGSGQVSGADVSSVVVSCTSPELDAEAISDSVTLDWVDVGASSYNLYYSSASDCDIANYASCADGTLLTNVTPPHTVTGLGVDQNWWFQLESVVTGANGVAQVGARPSQVSPKKLTGAVLNINHGNLYAIAYDDSGRTYLGGDFTSVANVSGRGVVASAARSDGTATGHARAYPIITGGLVLAAASDGNGGYYIGGDFTAADGQPRTRLAHILPSGELDPYWAPQADDKVYSIVVSGTTVYVGGYFHNIDGVIHNYLAAIDTDGNLQTWDPGLDGGVRAMQLSGSTLYIGGGFGTVGSDARGKLAAIDTTTGDLLGWTPAAVNDGEVRGLALYNGAVYFGGTFTQVGGNSRKYLAAVDTNGALATWDPQADLYVFALGISGSTIYVGGKFSSIGGVPLYGLGAIDVDGTVQSWPTGFTYNSGLQVYALAVHGDTVYVGSDMLGIQGAGLNYVAAYGTDGSFYNWDVAVDGRGYALAADDDTVFVGGEFNLQGGVARNNLAALEADDTLDLNWAPAANGTVKALAVSGSTVYVGGTFTTIDDGSGAQTRNRLAAIGTDGTLDTNWSPLANNAVYALAVDDSGTVYAGGAFTTINDGTSYTRSRLAAIESSGYVVSGWAPVANDDVFAVTVSGSTVYVGGNFSTINSNTRVSIAAIGTDGNLGSWSPAVSVNFPAPSDVQNVSDIVVSGSTVYIAGFFDSVDDGGGAQDRYSLASVGTDGSLTTWDPDVDLYVYDIALSGSTVYAAGDFTTIGGTIRNRGAAINTDTYGTLAALNPNLDNDDASQPKDAYAVDVHDGKVYFGGKFTLQGGTLSPILAIMPQ